MDWMEKELALLNGDSLERRLRDSATVPGRPGYIRRGGRLLLNLASNDYLGLAQHPSVTAQMGKALLEEGAGAGASRLITGNRPPYQQLEEAIAAWQKSESALVFANGYAANCGTISALVGREDVVFSDRLNHASIVDGIVLSRAEHVRYRHNDMEHLKHLLDKHRGKRRKLIVTDAVFSMDGDCAPLVELAALKEQYGAMLMVDEAHSGGIYGARGEGLCAELGLREAVDIHVGTFSKSFGLYGAYICGSRTLIRWLTNKARPLIYSTALPPSLICGIAAALELIQSEQWRREQLHQAGGMFRTTLRDAGFNVGQGDSPIIPVMIGDNEKALRFGEMLEQNGIAAAAIRPPTVPAGTARIRFSLSCDHEETELAEAAATVSAIGHQLGVL